MLIHWIWLSQLPGLSLRQKLRLLERFPDAEDIYNAPTDALEDCGEALGDKDLTQARMIQHKCQQRGIDILTYGTEPYPQRLQNIPDAPILLYCKGTVPDLSRRPVISVVGTRKASPYGMNVTKRLARKIAACGGLVASGGAAGIDTVALQSALDTGSPVLCVLGCGVDVAYPAKNRQLFAEIIQNGCILSEYPPGEKPEPWHFPQRNRILSGMANGVLVTEAPAKSGALITARQALEQGRDVFAVPGNIDVATCAGSNSLLQDGAAAVFTGWDLLRTYTAQYPDTLKDCPVEAPTEEKIPEKVTPIPEKTAPIDKKDIDIPEKSLYSGRENPPADLSPDEAQILAVLTTTPQSVDVVIDRVGMPSAKVLGILTKLALRGVVINHPGRMVSATNRRK